MKIIPAILANQEAEALASLRLAEQFAGFLHIDVMDGSFVPSVSVGGGFWEKTPPKIPSGAHLMVKKPLDYLASFVRAGVKRIIFHFEAVKDPLAVIAKIKSYPVSAGLAINPKTQIAEIKPCLPYLDYVLVMAVEPGFYGSPFIPEVLSKIPLLRELKGNFTIGLDGGVKKDNLLMIKKSGVEEACVGSYIFQSPEPEKNYRELCRLA